MPAKVVDGVKDTTTKYFMLAHGETKIKDPYTLVVPDNLQVVFLLDPELADATLCTNVSRIPDICKTADTAKRWVYGPGTYKIRALDLEFYKDPEDGDDMYKGFYNCDGSVVRIIDRQGEIPLPLAVSMFASTVDIHEPTSIYILACTLRDKYRGKAQTYTFGLAPDKPSGLPRGGRRPRTRRRHKKRRTRRHR